jgi:hypothetical protein
MKKPKQKLGMGPAFTQSGKTTEQVEVQIAKNPKIDYLCITPNSILALDELTHRLHAHLGDKHPYQVFPLRNLNSKKIAELHKIVETNSRLGVQNIFIVMGNNTQLELWNLCAVLNNIQKLHENYKIALLIDESDQYIIGHNPSRYVNKEIHLQKLLDSKAPTFEYIKLYTATPYVHALSIFSENSTWDNYDIAWDTSLLKKVKELPYWGYEGISTEVNEDLKNVWNNALGIFNPAPLIPIMEKLRYKDSMFIVHHRNDCQEAIRDWIHDAYDSDVFVIIANTNGVVCTSQHYEKRFNTLSAAADWALDNGANKLIWVGYASLNRMQSLVDSKKELPLANMVILSNKDNVENIIQLVGRMTGIFPGKQNYHRVLYSYSEVITNYKKAIMLDQYFVNKLLENGTITKEDFRNMPDHSSVSITAKRKMNGVKKLTHKLKPLTVFETLTDAYMEYGKRNCMLLQTLLDEVSGLSAIKADSRLITGRRQAGANEQAYRNILSGDPSVNVLRECTIFVTPDGKYIDNRESATLQNIALTSKIPYVITYSSEGKVQVFETSKLGEQTTSYNAAA